MSLPATSVSPFVRIKSPFSMINTNQGLIRGSIPAHFRPDSRPALRVTVVLDSETLRAVPVPINSFLTAADVRRRSAAHVKKNRASLWYGNLPAAPLGD